jgi:hypothetical protein
MQAVGYVANDDGISINDKGAFGLGNNRKRQADAKERNESDHGRTLD